MGSDICTLTVYFEDPFWVGLWERREEDGYSVCKVTFGAEPRDHQVYEALLLHWRELRFSPALPPDRREQTDSNPRRARRKAARVLAGPPVGTKAQEALKLQQTQGKEARRKKSREEREAEEARRFQLRQVKRQQKRRGR